MNTGLKQRDFDYINKALNNFNDIEKTSLFGSRAKGNYKSNSDIDLCIFAKNINPKTITKLNRILNEESSIPFFIDIVHYESLQNKELKNHIDRIGITI